MPGGLSDWGKSTVTVNSVNDKIGLTVPTDELTVKEDTILNVDGIHVTNPDGNAELLTLVLKVGRGTLSVNLDGIAGIEVRDNGSGEITLIGNKQQINQVLKTLQFAPAPNYHGHAQIVVTATDETGLQTIRRVQIEVRSVNDIPIVTLPDEPVIGDEDQTIDLNGFHVQNNDHDVITLELVAERGRFFIGNIPEGVEVVNNGKGRIFLTGLAYLVNRALHHLQYHPRHNDNGTVQITAHVQDAQGRGTTAHMLVTLNPVNDPPIVHGQQLETDEDKPIEITLQGTDVDEDTLHYVIVDGPKHGTLIPAPHNPQRFLYIPNPNSNGKDHFTFKVIDPSGAESEVRSVVIDVTPVNDDPIAHSQKVTTDEDAQIEFDLHAKDPDNDILTYVIVTGVSNGQLTCDGFHCTYVPAENFHGKDFFTFKAVDPSGAESPEKTVWLRINSVNDAPTGQDLNVTTPENQTFKGSLWDLASDPDNQMNQLVFELVAGPQSGNLFLGPHGKFRYQPNINFHGPDSFTYRIFDGENYSEVYTVSLTIEAAPAAVEDYRAALQEQVGENYVVVLLPSGTDAAGLPLYKVVIRHRGHPQSGKLIRMSYFVRLENDQLNLFTDETRQGYAQYADPSNLQGGGLELQGEMFDRLLSGLEQYGLLNPADPLNQAQLPDAASNLVNALASVSKIEIGQVSSGTDWQIEFSATNPYSQNVEHWKIVNANEQPLLLYNEPQADDTGMYVRLTQGTSLTMAEAVISSPFTTHVIFYVGWSTIETAPGVFDWSSVAPILQLVQQYNKKLLLNVSTYGGGASGNDPNFISPTPDWLYDYVDRISFTVHGHDDDGNPISYEYSVPNVWKVPSDQDPDPTHSYLYYYKRLMTELANFVKSSPNGSDGTPLISQVMVPFGMLGTTNPLGTTDGEQAFINAGWTEAVWQNFIIAAAAIARGELDGVPLMAVASPAFFSQAADAFSQDISKSLAQIGIAQTVRGADGRFDSMIHDGILDMEALLEELASYGADSFAIGDDWPLLYAGEQLAKMCEKNPNGFACNRDLNGFLNILTATIYGGDITIIGKNGLPRDYHFEPRKMMNKIFFTRFETIYANPNVCGENPEPGCIDLKDYTFHQGIYDVMAKLFTQLLAGQDPANIFPFLQKQIFAGDEDNVISGSISGSDENGDALSYALYGKALEHGTLTLNADGTFTFVPDADFNGTIYFNVQAFDGKAYSNVVTITFTINPVNDAPVVQDQSVSVDEDNPLTFNLTATDAEGDPFTISIPSEPAHGSLVRNQDGTYTYVPDHNFYGTDSFTYIANDGQVDSAPATVTIIVNPVNPSVPNEMNVTTPEDTKIKFFILPGNPNQGHLVLTILSGPQNGTINCSSNTNNRGEFTCWYNPNDDFNGMNSLTYQVNDGEDDSNIGVINFNVDPVNDVPISPSTVVPTNQDQQVSGTVSATDVDGDQVTYSLLQGPEHGTVTFNADGSYTYIPETGFFGADQFSYIVTDSNGAISDIAGVALLVNPAVPPQDDNPSHGLTGDEDLVLTGTLPNQDASGVYGFPHFPHLMNLLEDNPEADPRNRWFFNNPNLRGAAVQISWAEMNPAPGEYNFDKLQRLLDLFASQGKELILSLQIYPGSNNDHANLPFDAETIPSWVCAEGSGVTCVTITLRNDDGSMFDMKFPIFWDTSAEALSHPEFTPNAVFRDNLNSFLTELGVRFGNDPRLSGVIFGPGVFLSSRFMFPGVDTQPFAEVGYTDQRWYEALQYFADIYQTALPNTPMIMGVRPF